MRVGPISLFLSEIVLWQLRANLLSLVRLFSGVLPFNFAVVEHVHV